MSNVIPLRPGPATFDVCGALPTGTTLLEASAGTGKTWTIASLVARHVVEGHVPLDRMLVVTFGRAASQELRERVRERLVEAERALAGGPAGDGLLELLTDVEETERVERLRRVREALVDFDAATIATIHQFCQLVLAGLGVAGDSDRSAVLVENLDDLREEVVDDLYVRKFAPGDTAPAFSRRDATKIAKVAVGDPRATLEPRAATAETTAGTRLRFAEAVRREIDVRKRRLGVLSYDDLLGRLADALEAEDSPARERMRGRWSLVLVDEFQDTDPVQWQVFDRAFSGHATLVLIGDPKQAIYAFRGGDVDTYLQAKQTASAELTLGTNHRSDEPLVASLTAFLADAELGTDIVVRPVTAAHEGSRLAGLPEPSPFRLRLLDREQCGGAGAKPLAMQAVREVVPDDVAADVARLLSSGGTFRDGETDRPLQPGDVAVLAAKRADLDRVHVALAARGVRSVVAGSGNVVTTEAGTDWLVLLEALEQPHRPERVRAAALTAFLGHSAAELSEGGEPLTERLGDRLRDWVELLRARGVAAVFEVAVSEGGLTRRVLDVEDGERLLTDLRHLAELLHDRMTREGVGLTGLLTWLREQREEAERESDTERTRRLDSDAAAVQLVTIHGSKGLQYPVVYLPFVADYWERKEEFPLFHAEDGSRSIDVAGEDAVPAHVAKAKHELAQEQLRLLYVAMTRAQCQLVTWWFPSNNTATSAMHRLLMGRRPGDSGPPEPRPAVPTDAEAVARARAWQDHGGPRVERVSVSGTTVRAAALDAATLEARRWTRRVDRDWRRTSYTGLSRAAEEGDARAGSAEQRPGFASEPESTPKQDEPALPLVEELTAADGVPSPMGELPSGATFGSLVHAVLEDADPDAPDHAGDLHAELSRHIETQRVRWPVAVGTTELADALVAVCTSPLGPLLGGRTLATIPKRDRLEELDFELPLGGGDRPVGASPLSAAGPLLRRHLPEGDPLLPYADVLDSPGHQAQRLLGYLSGSVDLVARVDGRYVVVDYKTNWLGPFTDPPTPLTSGHYTPDRLAAAMTHSSYPLQALLYAVVLHRFLRWRLPGYDPDTHLGGVAYLYLRGMCGPDTPVVQGRPCGVFSWRPPVGLVEDLSDLLDGSPR
ncbi:UvrD-helicase domain-containing protein [Nocardioides marmoribigeumensis]|uniref:RecBCD enzyme subunit RecB n=1 Tax=Nocardioides marmoribigeumensis TaxID=433649 RepID=A0ABU2BV11_9ACTN|nr:UvrD-helicase domain-containing protein [Nocardioides marmoribigeumensis]MDR7362463.1 exodeoxyribonuclease V beta subunit [Nocardioides marmoribigeumensis]